VSAQQQQRAPGPGWVTLLRDFIAFTFPWVLIFKQAGIIFEPPAQVSESILLLAGAMLGVPGVAQILSMRFGASTGSSPSPEVQPGSQSGAASSPTSEGDPA
jgi:hypothetical protein